MGSFESGKFVLSIRMTTIERGVVREEVDA